MRGAREHGFLFRAAMCRALLVDRKHETRRPISHHNSLVNGEPFPRKLWPGLDFERAWIDPGASPAGNEGPYLQVPFVHPEDAKRGAGHIDERVFRVYPRAQRGDRIWVRETFRVHSHGAGVAYRADNDSPTGMRWSSPIHLPRWAARIVRDVHAQPYPQRIGDITPEQEALEGFPLPDSDPEGPCTFREYWARLHGPWTPRLWCWSYPLRVPSEGEGT